MMVAHSSIIFIAPIILQVTDMVAALSDQIVTRINPENACEALVLADTLHLPFLSSQVMQFIIRSAPLSVPGCLAVSRLDDLEPVDLLPLLVPFLRAEDTILRQNATQVLCTASFEKLFEMKHQLLSSLEDTDAVVRQAVVSALDRIPVAELEDFLCDDLFTLQVTDWYTDFVLLKFLSKLPSCNRFLAFIQPRIKHTTM